ncbi:carbon-nitrogen hydrolase family protein [Vogesella sp. LIG4]|uniref:carbon-nitrogen hydrolase family protein n=1 Tax=Vogesella sp. LIG4 TaxID=1192162 RepID=UPI00081FE471|nr:carbon-nitrogen hydrolase family protein [Vogesella sp. LIG4]SCK22562.1 (R)-amidase [Vogesella sp. LIG4]
MSTLKLRLLQASCRDGDPAANLEKALAAIHAASGQADLLVLPETFVPGFPTAGNIAELAEPLDGPVVSALRAAAQAARVAVAIGVAERRDDGYYNCGLLIDADGSIVLDYRKSHLYLSDQGVFQRGRQFPVVTWRGIRIGLLICFDIEFPETARQLAHQGAELIVVLDGNMQPYGRVHRMAVPMRAMENQLFVAMCNRVGPGDDYTFCGESQVADPYGNTLLLASGEDEQMLDISLDLTQVAAARRDYDYLALALG